MKNDDSFKGDVFYEGLNGEQYKRTGLLTLSEHGAWVRTEGPVTQTLYPWIRIIRVEQHDGQA